MSLRTESSTLGFEEIPPEDSFHTFSAFIITTTAQTFVAGKATKRMVITDFNLGGANVTGIGIFSIVNFYNDTTSSEIYRHNISLQDSKPMYLKPGIILATGAALKITVNADIGQTAPGAAVYVGGYFA